MKLLETICKELGVEIGEEWVGEWTTGNRYTNYSKIKFTETELLCYRKDYKSWVAGNSFLSDLIYGRLKPIWKPSEGEVYYVPYINYNFDGVFYNRWEWQSESGSAKWHTKLGIVFKTKEEAIECANKMLSVIKED